MRHAPAACVLVLLAVAAPALPAACPGEPPWTPPSLCGRAGCDAADAPEGALLAEAPRGRLRGVRAREVCYLHDGLRLMGYVVLPEGRGRAALPALLYMHGGMAHGRGLDAGDLDYLAFLAREGPFAVLAPQYRGHGGSDGADELGGRDVSDAAALYRLAVDRGWASPAPARALGFSRGSGMALLLPRAGVPLAAAALVAVVADLGALHPRLGPMRRRGLEQAVGGSPEEVPAAYLWRSPLAHPESMRVPTLLLHAAHDPILPVSQARRLAAALEEAGTPTRLMVFPGGDHLLGGRAAARDRALLEWLRDPPAIPTPRSGPMPRGARRRPAGWPRAPGSPTGRSGGPPGRG